MPRVQYDSVTIEALEKDFIRIAYALFRNRQPSSSILINDRRLRGWCGCSPTVIAKLWNLLERFGNLKERSSKERLLWALHLLAAYPNKETGAAICKTDEKTFLTWAWYLIEEISYLEQYVVCMSPVCFVLCLYPLSHLLPQILWDNRKRNDIGNTCLASIDGADFRIKGTKLDSGDSDPRFFSYKFKAPGLRYMVALSIRTSDIVYLAGPYLPGVYNDLMIFRDCGIKDEMEQREKVEADDGYKAECPAYTLVPGWHNTRTDQKKMKARVRMRHEHVNKRMKNFKCLLERFRSSPSKHSCCFRAVAIVTQLSMETGEPMIDMREYDDRLTDLQVQQMFGI